MSVPEASVHEDSRAVRPHDDVRLAGHALHVQAVAVAVVPQPLPHLQLGFRVPAADVRHATVPLLGSHRVGHKAMFFCQISDKLYTSNKAQVSQKESQLCIE